MTVDGYGATRCLKAVDPKTIYSWAGFQSNFNSSCPKNLILYPLFRGCFPSWKKGAWYIDILREQTLGYYVDTLISLSGLESISISMGRIDSYPLWKAFCAITLPSKSKTTIISFCTVSRSFLPLKLRTFFIYSNESFKGLSTRSGVSITSLPFNFSVLFLCRLLRFHSFLHDGFTWRTSAHDYILRLLIWRDSSSLLTKGACLLRLQAWECNHEHLSSK